MTTKEFIRFFSKLNKPYILLLIGPPLSGKDSLLRQLDLSDTTVISRDDILMSMSGTDDYSTAFNSVNQKDVDIELQRQLQDAADNGRNCVINMTNMTSKRRQHNLQYFDDDFTKVAVIFPILDWEDYQIRNEKRKREENKWIPENVIRNMIKSYQPIRDEEGFNRVVSL